MSVPEADHLSRSSVAYFLESNQKMYSLKKFKKSLFERYNLTDLPRNSMFRYFSFPQKGIRKQMVHTRRRLHNLFELGLKVYNFTGKKYNSLMSSGENLITHMFSGIPTYVFSQATGKELAWEDLFYAGSLKQW